MEILQAFGIFEIAILIAGMAFPVISEIRSAWNKNPNTFEIGVYWKQNWIKVITGVGLSFVALVLLLAITPLPELHGVLFRFSIFTCGYSPNQFIQTEMKRRKNTPNE